MGHNVCYCDFCKSPVMEGHNDWDCDCGASMAESTGFKWIKKDKKEKKAKKSKKSKYDKIIF